LGNFGYILQHMAFRIHTFQQNGFNIIALQDIENNTQVEVIPALGAMLHAFTIMRNGQPLNIIDNYKSVDEHQQELNTSFKGVKLSPYACRIPNGQYHWQDKVYQVSRLAASGHAVHGLLYDAAFDVVEQYANEQEAVLVLQHCYTGADAGYPFAYDCRVRYQLQRDNNLLLSTTLVNKAGTAIPVMDGWHPYFTTGTPVDELELQFASQLMIEFNQLLVPNGELVPCEDYLQPRLLEDEHLDNSFLLDFTQTGPYCTLFDPQQRIQIDLYPDDNYPVLQVYTPPHRRSIAIENLSAAPDAFNNGMGLQQLHPGAEQTFNTRIQVRLA
jgi:aldose 1-epimerase